MPVTVTQVSDPARCNQCANGVLTEPPPDEM
jgi:hypothetical protein